MRCVDLLALTEWPPAWPGYFCLEEEEESWPELPPHVLGGFLPSHQPTLSSTDRSHQCEEKRK